MVGYPGAGPWPAIRRDLERPSRRPVVAVVAFIGVDAPTVMPLRRDDTLVCDASRLAIARGLTNVSALRTFRRRGIQIFSISGLHAKVIASPTSAWVGSANASTNSQERLLEASVRVTGAQARSVYRWACSLVTEDAEQSAADLRALAAIKVDRDRPGPSIETLPTELPDRTSLLWFLETGEELTAADEKAVSEDRSSARSAAVAAGISASLDYVVIVPDLPNVKVGDWMIDIRNGHVRYPAKVVRVRRSRGNLIIWHAPVRTGSRPTVAALRAVVPGIESSFKQLRISGSQRTKAVLDLFR